jgi:hypothetical protein
MAVIAIVMLKRKQILKRLLGDGAEEHALTCRLEADLALANRKVDATIMLELVLEQKKYFDVGRGETVL